MKQSRKKWGGTGEENGRTGEKEEEHSMVYMYKNAMMNPIILYGNWRINKVDYKRIVSPEG